MLTLPPISVHRIQFLYFVLCVISVFGAKVVNLQYSPQYSFHPARIYPAMCTCYEVVKLHRYLQYMQYMFESLDRYTYDLNVHVIVNFGGGLGDLEIIEKLNYGVINGFFPIRSFLVE